MSYKALIFDLDDTLFPTADHLIPAAMEDVSRQLRQYDMSIRPNKGLALRDQMIQEGRRKDFFEELIFHHAPENTSHDTRIEAAETAKHTFYQRAIPEDIETFPMVKDYLYPAKKKYKLFLVTSGEKQTQRDKIRILGLEVFFEDIFICDPDIKDSKRQAFETILSRLNCQPTEVACIGNRIESEIRIGHALGFHTIWLESQEIDDSSASDVKPDESIFTFRELFEKCPV